jgi:MarR family transcriptional regulator, lower aerobic nicotinate degradation pathway regulator
MSRATQYSLTDGIFQLSFALQACLGEIAAEHDLSTVQIRLLGILRDREPGMLELAGHLGLEKSSLSGLVDRAESRGLVERIPSTTDRRAATIRVTARGRKLSQVIEQAVRARVELLVRPLAESERRQLAALVWRVLG